MKLPVVVSGVAYTDVGYHSATGAISLAKTVDGAVVATLQTNMHELKTQYGRRTAFLVYQALLKKGIVADDPD